MSVINKSFQIRGKSGSLYDFIVYTLDHEFSGTTCTYIYTNLTKNAFGHDLFVNAYCGETDDLNSRISKHNSDQDIASPHNCICIKVASSKEQAKEWQDDILKANYFPDNKQLN